jgi:hypothetical protein
MKTTKVTNIFKQILQGILAIIIISSFSSCAKKTGFQASSVVPAARGNVKVSKDRNKDFVISVSLLDLAEPNRLTPPMHTYVVWMLTEDNITKNIGQIKTSTSMFSRTLKGYFKTVSSFKPVRIIVTAEERADIQTPGTFEVLSTNNF